VCDFVLTCRFNLYGLMGMSCNAQVATEQTLVHRVATRPDLPVTPQRMSFVAVASQRCPSNVTPHKLCIAEESGVGGMGGDTPYAVVGMYFHSQPSSFGVSPLSREGTAPSKPHVLGVGVDDPHLVCASALRDALVALLFEAKDALEGLPADQDLNAKRMQAVPRYGTVHRED
jgi:hypothetical protein